MFSNHKNLTTCQYRIPHCGCGRSCGQRSNRSYFGKIPQSKEKLEKIANYPIDVKMEFLMFFWDLHYFLNSVSYEELKMSSCFFRTSRISGINPFFYVPVLKYYLLHKDSVFSFYIFSNFSVQCDVFTDFENSIFHKIPATRIYSRKTGYGRYLNAQNKSFCVVL